MRTIRVHGACLTGTSAELVSVEAGYDRARAEAGGSERTEVVLTGLPDAVVRESRGRLMRALAANGLGLRPGRLFLNLVPAARRKTGETLDLPLALAACAAGGHLQPSMLKGALFLGELGIDGKLHAVRGGLAAALAGRERDLMRVIAPPATAAEAAWVPGIQAFGPPDLRGVVALLFGASELQPLEPRERAPQPGCGESLDDVRGQDTAKLALAVAAAGRHGLLFVGPPGTGKSMLARRLRELLPPPTLEERLDVSCIQSAAGLWPGGLVSERPVRAPHHSVSHAGLVGGGAPPGPGEITLAHRGVLFLDELPEFKRDALEALRTPLEEGRVRLARAGRRVELPASFQLVCAMNPCPCGYLGHGRLPCSCSAGVVARYRRRISGPLLDRIELRVELPPPTLDELTRTTGARNAASSADALRQRVLMARERQRVRQGEQTNDRLSADDLDQWAPVSAEGRALLDHAARARGLSARAVQSLRRVARTLADLDDQDEVDAQRLARALALRAPIP